MTIGERLHDLRRRAGMTQERLAELSRINVWTVRNYEQGRREPTWRGLLDLAKALGVQAEAFEDCESKMKVKKKPATRKARRV